MIVDSQDSNKEYRCADNQDTSKIKLRTVLFTTINGKLGMILNEDQSDKSRVSVYKNYSIHHAESIGWSREFESLIAESIKNEIVSIETCLVHQTGLTNKNELSINYSIITRKSNIKATDKYNLFLVSLSLVYKSNERKIEKLYFETEDHSRYSTYNIITEIDKHSREWQVKRAIYLNRDSSNIILSREDIQAIYNAIKHLQDQADKTSYIYNMLKTEFSIGDAQKLYESIISKSCISCNYRKKFLDSNMFEATGNSREYRGREVALYKINKYSIIDYLG